MLTRLARRTFLLMALALGIGLLVPSTNWSEEPARLAQPSAEEEVHTPSGFLCGADIHIAWRSAAHRLGSKHAAMMAAQAADLPDGPVHDVSVPPPRTGIGAFRS